MKMAKQKKIKRDVKVLVEFVLAKTEEKEVIDKECGCNTTYDPMAMEIMLAIKKALRKIDRNGILDGMCIEVKDKKTDKSLVLIMG